MTSSYLWVNPHAKDRQVEGQWLHYDTCSDCGGRYGVLETRHADGSSYDEPFSDCTCGVAYE